MLKNILAELPRDLKATLEQSFPRYRYAQLMKWIYKDFVHDPHLMSNLPSDLKEYLQQMYSFALPKIDISREAQDGTCKYRLRLEDSSLIEMVLIPDGKKRTLCVSSQVGCHRGCSFCATGKMGFIRNLEVHEIVGQIILASSISAPHRLTNLVFMGMGEPMDNLDNVLQALRIIQDDDGLSFSPRRTTISTCGIADSIRRLADSGIKAKLAVSLNSAIDDKRKNLMPVTNRFPLSELKQALLYFLRKTSFRVTFEYILIPDFNMGQEDLKALKKYVGDLSCKLNFIPFNEVPGLPYRSPSEEEISRFLQNAQCLNQAVTLRRSRGSEVMGACGQLIADQSPQDNQSKEY